MPRRIFTVRERSALTVRGRLMGVSAALALALAGCAGATNTGNTVAGSTLTIYASVPPGGVDAQQTQDVIAAERLALAQAGGQVGKFRVQFTVLNQGKLSDDARTAVLDQSAVAYIGDLIPGTSWESLGITNGPSNQPLLQVSPTDDAAELTVPSAAVPNSPTVYYQALSGNGRTFGRVVPINTYEASALAQAIKAAGVKKLFVASDGAPGHAGDYGKALANAVANDVTARGVTVVGGTGSPTAQQVTSKGADAVFLGTNVESTAANLFNAVALASPKVKLFGSSALDDDGFVAGLIAQAQSNLEIVRPGFTGNRSLTAAGAKFVADFKSATGRDPGPGGGSAIFGYEAMALVLDILRQSGSNAGNHADVVKEFHSIKSRVSVLGTYMIDANGDTTLTPRPYVLEHPKLGKLVPLGAQLQG